MEGPDIILLALATCFGYLSFTGTTAVSYFSWSRTCHRVWAPPVATAAQRLAALTSSRAYRQPQLLSQWPITGIRVCLTCLRTVSFVIWNCSKLCGMCKISPVIVRYPIIANVSRRVQWLEMLLKIYCLCQFTTNSTVLIQQYGFSSHNTLRWK